MSHKDFNLGCSDYGTPEGMECICDKSPTAWPFGIQIPDDQIIACHHAEDCPVYLLSQEFQQAFDDSHIIAQYNALWEDQWRSHNTLPVQTHTHRANLPEASEAMPNPFQNTNIKSFLV